MFLFILLFLHAVLCYFSLCLLPLVLSLGTNETNQSLSMLLCINTQRSSLNLLFQILISLRSLSLSLCDRCSKTLTNFMALIHAVEKKARSMAQMQKCILPRGQYISYIYFVHLCSCTVYRTVLLLVLFKARNLDLESLYGIFKCCRFSSYFM